MAMDMTSQETMPIRKSAFWEQKGSGNGQISRANQKSLPFFSSKVLKRRKAGKISKKKEVKQAVEFPQVLASYLNCTTYP